MRTLFRTRAVITSPHKRQDSSSSPSPSRAWEDANTCGWYADELSSPYVCPSPSTCSTNTDAVVACLTGSTTSAGAGFYTACHARHYCSLATAPRVLCCSDTDRPECGEVVWQTTGTPVRSMLGCYTAITYVGLNDEPLVVGGASGAGTTATSTSFTTETPLVRTSTSVVGTITTVLSDPGSFPSSAAASSTPVTPAPSSSVSAGASYNETGNPLGLSAGEKVGIGSGIGVGVPLIFLLAFLYLRHAKQRRGSHVGESAFAHSAAAQEQIAGGPTGAASPAKAELEDPGHLRGQLQSGAYQGKPELGFALRPWGVGERRTGSGWHDGGAAAVGMVMALRLSRWSLTGRLLVLWG